MEGALGMINSKKELRFYLMADMMMNRGCFNYSIKSRIKNLIVADPIMKYLRYLRKMEYAMTKEHGFVFFREKDKIQTKTDIFGIKVGIFYFVQCFWLWFGYPPLWNNCGWGRQ